MIFQKFTTYLQNIYVEKRIWLIASEISVF